VLVSSFRALKKRSICYTCL